MSALSDAISAANASADALAQRVKDEQAAHVADHAAEEQKVADLQAKIVDMQSKGQSPDPKDLADLAALRAKLDGINLPDPPAGPDPVATTVGNSTHPDTGAPVTSQTDPNPPAVDPAQPTTDPNNTPAT